MIVFKIRKIRILLSASLKTLKSFEKIKLFDIEEKLESSPIMKNFSNFTEMHYQMSRICYSKDKRWIY